MLAYCEQRAYVQDCSSSRVSQGTTDGKGVLYSLLLKLNE